MSSRGLVQLLNLSLTDQFIHIGCSNMGGTVLHINLSNIHESDSVIYDVHLSLSLKVPFTLAFT